MMHCCDCLLEEICICMEWGGMKIHYVIVVQLYVRALFSPETITLANALLKIVINIKMFRNIW